MKFRNLMNLKNKKNNKLSAVIEPKQKSRKNKIKLLTALFLFFLAFNVVLAFFIFVFWDDNRADTETEQIIELMERELKEVLGSE